MKVGACDRKRLISEARSYQVAKAANYFLPIEFETLQEYLSLHELCGKKLGSLNEQASFYLAAAVSDFYIPDEKVHRTVRIQCVT